MFLPKISPPAPKCQLVNIGFLKLEMNTNILIYVNLWRTAGWTHLKKNKFLLQHYLEKDTQKKKSLKKNMKTNLCRSDMDDR